MLSDGQIKSVLADYGVQADARQCGQVRSYIALLLKWNRSISLTSVTNETEILRFHFGESVFALSAIGGIIGRLADVGAGAGFPGLPLRIFSDRIELSLIESNSKKSAFLGEVVRQLDLSGTIVMKSRYGDLSGVRGGRFEIIVSRALGGYGELLRWSASVLAPAGMVILWLGEDDAEQLTVVASEWVWRPKVPIPRSKRRFLVAGAPLGPNER
jgi:16S rRNA (guanine527-N7)-methyltransferase